MIVIEEADRYGISQLHQLRGRVGRGAHESYCMLFSDARSELARRRLEAVAAERDGFRLAEIDLTLRGEGDVFGTRQHGLPEFRVARLPEDAELLELARAWSIDLLGARPRARGRRARGPALDARPALRRARGRADRGLRHRARRRRPVSGAGASRRRAGRTTADAGPGARGAVQHPRPGRRACGCSTSTPAPGRSASRRSRAGRRRPRSSTPTRPRCGPCARTWSGSASQEARVFRADALSFLRGAARHGDRWDLVLLRPAI